MQVDSGTAGLDVVSPVKTGSLEAEAWMDEVLDDVAPALSFVVTHPPPFRCYEWKRSPEKGGLRG